MKKSIALILFFISSVLHAQTPDAEGSLVKWLSIEEGMELVEKNPKPIIMDFYTDWCGWCKHMMKTTYANPGLAQYINTNFYPIKFDAEGKDTVTYLGEVYKPTGPGPKAPHELAVKLLQGKLMYPTTLFLNNFDKEKKEFGLNMVASGFLEDKKIEPILIFCVENVNRNASLDEFRLRFEEAFYDTALEARLDDIEWELPASYFANTSPLKKKTIVFINTSWCNACKVMKRTSFTDTLLSPYLKEKFHLLDFDATSSDTLSYKGNVFVNQNSPQTPFHQLASALCRNNFVLPSIIMLDEKMDIIDAIPFYLPPSSLSDIVHYFGDDVYKVKSWQDYMAKKKEPEQK